MSWFGIRWYFLRGISFAYTQRVLAFVLRLPLPPKVSVAAIIKNDLNQYLVVDLSYREGYALPGGLVEPDENLEEAVAREIKEETGLDTETILYITSKEDTQYGLPVLAVGYLVSTTGTIKSSAEGTALWVSAEEYLAKVAYSNSGKIFTHYLETYESTST